MEKLREIKIIKRGERSLEVTRTIHNDAANGKGKAKVAERIKEWVLELKERKRSEEQFARQLLSGVRAVRLANGV